MAQAVTVAGASYTDVPGVNLPKTGGGTAYFPDVSDTTATDSDVASGKVYYKADGTKSTGTGSGGGGGGIIIEDTADPAGGTVRTITAVEIAGTKSITQNGTGIDVTEYAAVDVAVPTGSSKAIYKYEGLTSRQANSYGATSATVTVTKAGTYNISFVAIRGSSSGTMGTNLHIGATSGTDNQTWNNGTYGQYATLTNQQIAANTAVTIYATSGSTSRYIYVGQLIVEEV